MDQYKGFLDSARDTPVTFPDLRFLRIGAAIVVALIIAWALLA